MNENEESKTMVFENKMLRKYFGQLNSNGECRIRYNEEISHLCRDSVIASQ